MRIPDADERVLGEQDKGVRALKPSNRFGERVPETFTLCARKQVQDNLAVGGGAEQDIVQLRFELRSIREVPVVTERDLFAAHEDTVERLGVSPLGRTGRRIAIVTDGVDSLKPHQISFCEDVGDEAHAFVDLESLVSPVG